MVLKKRLFTPGPTPIPARVLEAMHVSGLHHRTDAFKSLLEKTALQYKQLVDCETTPVFLSGSGTAAMDAAVSQCVAKNEKLLVLSAGKFGERWIEIANKRSLSVEAYERPWGESIEEESFRTFIKTHKDASALCMQYCETSTAILHPLKTIQKILREEAPSMLLIVDGITAVGTCPISMKEDGIDVLLCGSQKALMLPPGLAIVSASKRAWDKMYLVESDQYYLDLVKEYKSQAKGVTAFTPAISLIAGLHCVLTLFEEEGIDAVYARHTAMQKLFRNSLSAFGFRLSGEEACAAPGVTLAHTTESCDAEALRLSLQKNAGIQCAGGQDSLKGTVIRFGHMGYHDCYDACGVIHAVARCLYDLQGDKTSIDAGLKALSETMLTL